MTELVRQQQLGDITFGVPVDIELLNTPFGFYKFLGINKEASIEEIRKAYRKLAIRLHSDSGGDEQQFKTLQKVIETLSDDGDKLGIEHSRRNHYDRVSSLDEYFDGFISYKSERTKKLSEIMLIHMQIERKHAEAERKIVTKFPQFTDLKKRLQESKSKEVRERILEEIMDLSAKAAGLTPETRKEIDEIIEEQHRRLEKEQTKFLSDFRNNPGRYFSKILDIYHVGDGNVMFGPYANFMQLSLVRHEETDNILRLVLGGNCHISGFSQVHFKSEEANIGIIDTNLTGIFHVVNGNIVVDYGSSSYGNVIRARAPNIDGVYGFEQKGDLFVPTRFATQNWWRKKPTLDLAVKDGIIRLKLRSQDLCYKKYDLFSNSNIIDNNIFINKKFY